MRDAKLGTPHARVRERFNVGYALLNLAIVARHCRSFAARCASNPGRTRLHPERITAAQSCVQGGSNRAAAVPLVGAGRILSRGP